MSDRKTGFVFVHGAWHDHHCWRDVVADLAERGHTALAIDLPGAGANAPQPASFGRRATDPAAFATEPSPNAGVTQAERNTAVMGAIHDVAGRSNGRVVLVGHSLGGVTLAPVAEAHPETLAAVVFVTAFMLPPGMPAAAMIQDPRMADALVPPLFRSDPEVTGALRVDSSPADEEGLAALKAAFYGDLDDSAFRFAVSHLHCDEPVQVALEPSPVTAKRFGTVPRHYVRCTQDRAILIAGQDGMIADVDAALGSRTSVHTLEASHSPFLSKPHDLADILVAIAE